MTAWQVCILPAAISKTPKIPPILAGCATGQSARGHHPQTTWDGLNEAASERVAWLMDGDTAFNGNVDRQLRLR